MACRLTEARNTCHASTPYPPYNLRTLFFIFPVGGRAGSAPENRTTFGRMQRSRQKKRLQKCAHSVRMQRPRLHSVRSSLTAFRSRLRRTQRPRLRYVRQSSPFQRGALRQMQKPRLRSVPPSPGWPCTPFSRMQRPRLRYGQKAAMEKRIRMKRPISLRSVTAFAPLSLLARPAFRTPSLHSVTAFALPGCTALPLHLPSSLRSVTAFAPAQLFATFRSTPLSLHSVTAFAPDYAHALLQPLYFVTFFASASAVRFSGAHPARPPTGKMKNKERKKSTSRAHP